MKRNKKRYPPGTLVEYCFADDNFLNKKRNPIENLYIVLDYKDQRQNETLVTVYSLASADTRDYYTDSMFYDCLRECL